MFFAIYVALYNILKTATYIKTQGYYDFSAKLRDGTEKGATRY